MVGKGFEIGLVDVGTGADIALPAGVNTADDELHPALTPDGRFLVFTREQVRPLLNGNVIPPAARTVVMVDLQTGAARAPISTENATGTGATITPGLSGGQDRLAYGVRPPAGRSADSTSRLVTVGKLDPPGFFAVPPDFLTVGGPVSGESDTSVLDVPGATMLQRSDGRTHGYTQVLFDPGSGLIRQMRLLLEVRQGTSSTPANTFTTTGQHPALRPGDGYAAFSDLTGGVFADIHTILVPGQATADRAPDPINAAQNAAQYQTMPAWSPDANKLAFVRRGISNPDRKLLVYDATPGIQTIVNAGIDLGDPAPTDRLRAFHDVWGNISLANLTRSDSVAVTCTAACLSTLNSGIIGGLKIPPLAPTTSGGGVPQAAVSSPGTKIGIIVARIVGTRKLLGRTVPRIRPLGRVPLGLAVRGRHSFRWNGKVAGRLLGPGEYLLTYRVLTRKGRVQAVSKSIRFRVTKSGRITGARTVQG